MALIPVDRLATFWGREGTVASRFRKRGSRAYRTYLWSIPLLLLLFLDSLTLAPLKLLPLWLISTSIWTLWVLIALFIVGKIDVYDAVPQGIRLAVFLWSAGIVNLATMMNMVVIPPIEFDIDTAIIRAPFVEEALKLFGVALIVGISPCLTARPLPVIMCGTLSGLGFAYLENAKLALKPLRQAYELLLLNGRSADYHPIWDSFAWMVERGILSTPWLHSFLTVVSSLGIYFFAKYKNRSPVLRVIAVLSFYLLACVIHGLNNWIHLSDWRVSNIRLVDGVYQVATLASFVMLVFWGLGREQVWFAAITDTTDPFITLRESKRLITRTSRTEQRIQFGKAAGRKSAKLLGWQQKLQLAYANALGEADSMPQVKGQLDQLQQEIQNTRVQLGARVAQSNKLGSSDAESINST